MIKTYKHKQTGDVAELVNTSGYKLNKSTIGLIPVEYIENSNDWELIVENRNPLISENNKSGSGNRGIESIKLDSGVEITMEQVKEIVEFLKTK